jgi:predicted nuclease of restriction endonuclease-like (RecB) superfamily
MSELLKNNDYKNWFVDLKQKIQQSQIKAALAVNSQLILLYWDLGKQIVEKQENSKWGSGFIDQLSKDLKLEFPDMGGFSSSNIYAIIKFYKFYNQKNLISEQVVLKLKNEIVHQVDGKLENEIVRQVDGETIQVILLKLCTQIPWLHNIVIIEKTKEIEKILFYIQQTIKNNWSRAVLLHQIESNLYNRQGKAVNNFALTLPKPQSDLANEIMKDPYSFHFLQMTEKYNENDLEKALTHNITQFLLELGSGFSFVGKQFPIKLDQKEYRIDLLFYHLKLRCFIVIDLKVVDFEPEFAGKLNFYLNVIDDQMKHESDNPTIGMIICKTKNTIEAEYSLKGIDKPIGISEYELLKILPEKFKGSLPSIEEIENELKNSN